MNIDFNYCVWAVFKEDHPWTSLTNGFQPHMTIKSHLNLREALRLKHQITAGDNRWNQVISLLGTEVQEISSLSGLSALVQSVQETDLEPWPKGAHVSFRYRYHEAFPLSEINEVNELLQEHSLAEIVDIVVMKCNGHFSTWSRH
jgi:hypothetical protein